MKIAELRATLSACFSLLVACSGHTDPLPHDGPDSPLVPDGHRCRHDELQRNLFSRSPPIAGMQSYAAVQASSAMDEFPLLAPALWAPLRIFPEYLYDFDATMDAKEPGLSAWVKGTLVPEAIARFSAMLQVRPVEGKLQAHRNCLEYDESYTPAVCSRYESETSVSIPKMTYDIPDREIPAEYLAEDTIVRTVGGKKTIETLPAGSGGWSADHAWLISGIQTVECGSEGSGTLAYATFWQQDNFDRPTISLTNLCPAALARYKRNNQLEDALSIVLHEFTHCLAMSSWLYPLFRSKDAAMTPLTPRNPLYPFLPSDDYDYKYRCGIFTYETYLPAATTLDWFDERGMSCNRSAPKPLGNCVMRLVTPAMKAAAATFFDCPSLPGPEVENDDTSYCDVVGSHWETRLMIADRVSLAVIVVVLQEASSSLLVTPASFRCCLFVCCLLQMNPYLFGMDSGFTTMTVALLDDSGWYQADFSKAYGSRKGTTFGYKQGCAFARDKKCLNNNADGALVGMGTPPHYHPVTRFTPEGQCTLDRRGFGVVGIYIWSQPLPEQYRYFSNSTYGGLLAEADFCTFMVPERRLTANPTGLCYSPSDVGVGGLTAIDKDRGMLYGPSSYCLETTLSASATTAGSVVAGCYKWVCGPTGTTATVTTVSGDSQVCSTEGQLLTFPGYIGSIICPDIASLCAPRSLALDTDVSLMNITAIRMQQAKPLSPFPAGPSDSNDGRSSSSLSEGQLVGIGLGAVAVGAVLVAALGAALFVGARRNAATSGGGASGSQGRAAAPSAVELA
jgi:Leishmanolysin